jgi:hypothetical protein
MAGATAVHLGPIECRAVDDFRGNRGPTAVAERIRAANYAGATIGVEYGLEQHPAGASPTAAHESAAGDHEYDEFLSGWDAIGREPRGAKDSVARYARPLAQCVGGSDDDDDIEPIAAATKYA